MPLFGKDLPHTFDIGSNNVYVCSFYSKHDINNWWTGFETECKETYGMLPKLKCADKVDFKIKVIATWLTTSFVNHMKY